MPYLPGMQGVEWAAQRDPICGTAFWDARRQGSQLLLISVVSRHRSGRVISVPIGLGAGGISRRYSRDLG